MYAASGNSDTFIGLAETHKLKHYLLSCKYTAQSRIAICHILVRTGALFSIYAFEALYDETS